MGVDLVGREGREYFDWTAWQGCLDVARGYGWQPENPCWTYFACDQAVSDQDATALAYALDRAITEGPRIEHERAPSDKDKVELYEGEGKLRSDDTMFSKRVEWSGQPRLAVFHGQEINLRQLYGLAANGGFLIG